MYFLGRFKLIKQLRLRHFRITQIWTLVTTTVFHTKYFPSLKKKNPPQENKNVKKKEVML